MTLLPRRLARPVWRAFRFCLNGGDSQHLRPAKKAFDRTLKRYMTEFDFNRGSLLDGDFSEHFRCFSEKPLLRRIHPYVFDMFNLPYRDYLYARIADLLRDGGKSVPQLETVHRDQACFAEIVNRPSACVVLALHNGFPHVARLLSTAGRTRLTTMLTHPEQAVPFYRHHHVPHCEKVRVLQVDRNVLVRLNASVKDDHAICCLPDHINPETGKCDLISRAMFEFSARKGIQIYFLDFAVTDQGKLKVFSERAERSANVDDAMEQFSQFCFHSSGRRVTAIKRAR